MIRCANNKTILLSKCVFLKDEIEESSWVYWTRSTNRRILMALSKDSTPKLRMTHIVIPTNSQVKIYCTPKTNNGLSIPLSWYFSLKEQ